MDAKDAKTYLEDVKPQYASIPNNLDPEALAKWVESANFEAMNDGQDDVTKFLFTEAIIQTIPKMNTAAVAAEKPRPDSRQSRISRSSQLEPERMNLHVAEITPGMTTVLIWDAAAARNPSTPRPRPGLN